MLDQYRRGTTGSLVSRLGWGVLLGELVGVEYVVGLAQDGGREDPGLVSTLTTKEWLIRHMLNYMAVIHRELTGVVASLSIR